MFGVENRIPHPRPPIMVVNKLTVNESKGILREDEKEKRKSQALSGCGGAATYISVLDLLLYSQLRIPELQVLAKYANIWRIVRTVNCIFGVNQIV